MIEYYLKMLQEHPLISFVEDAFSQYDFPAHKAFRDKLANEFPNVNMALKQLFSRGGIKRMKAVTDFQYFGGAKATAQSPEDAAANGATSPEGKSSADEGVTSKMSKKTPTPAGKKTPV
jgi:hypothetical protein